MATSQLHTAEKIFRSFITQNGQPKAILDRINKHSLLSAIINTGCHHVKISSLCVARKASRLFHTTAFSSSPSCDTTSSPHPKLSLCIAASYVAKENEFNSHRDIFDFKIQNIDTTYLKSLTRQQHQKLYMHNRPRTGQDAFFVSQVGQTPDVVIGIADGVGGWSNSGVDPSDFSHGLCYYMKYVASTYEKNEWGGADFDPRSLLQRGYTELCQDQSVEAGSSTACIAVARSNGILQVANLGDSGYIQIRLNTVHSHSDPQTHSFNTPYQLSIIPDRIRIQTELFGNPYLDDLPQDANIIESELKHGDVLVFGSDGLWDNLFYSDILKIVSRKMLRTQAWKYSSLYGYSVGENLAAKVYESPSGVIGHSKSSNLHGALATNITAEAKAASVNSKRDGPFSRDVKKYEPYMYHRGGKMDDICVIVAIVCEKERETS